MYLLAKSKLSLLIFVGPVFIFYTYFIIISTFNTFYYSLTTWDAITQPVFTGLNNYIDLFESRDFGIVMRNTVIGWVIALMIQIPLGLIFAYLIYKTRLGFRIYRGLIFLPVVMAPASVALMFILIFNADIGAVNNFLEILGLDFLKRSWLSDTNVVFYSVLTPMIYQFIGFYVVILLAGMQSIPEDILESALIDGANSLRTFVYIVIPMLKDIILVCVVLLTMGAFKAFEHAFIMTWGGPGVRSAFLGVYMYFVTFVRADFGKGSAVAIVILLCAMLLTLIFNALSKKYDF